MYLRAMYLRAIYSRAMYSRAMYLRAMYSRAMFFPLSIHHWQLNWLLWLFLFEDRGNGAAFVDVRFLCIWRCRWSRWCSWRWMWSMWLGRRKKWRCSDVMEEVVTFFFVMKEVTEKLHFSMFDFFASGGGDGVGCGV